MSSKMKAIGQDDLGDSSVLKLVDLDKPKASGRDIVVKILSVATNPVDTKKRAGYLGKFDHTCVLGFDAAGIVDSVGPEAKMFQVGDEVYFAGNCMRQGCHAEFCAVDERIVAKKPKSLTFDQAATIPLVVLTAWEGLIEGMGIPIPKTEQEAKVNSSKSILIIGGAGGVGSIVTQISKHLLKIGRVIATASREETIKYCKAQGADLTIDHSKPLAAQLKELGVAGVDYLYDCVDLDIHLPQFNDIINPLAKIVTITGLAKPNLSFGFLFMKRATLIPEFMFARAIHNCEPEKQHEILAATADLLDKGVLKHCLMTQYKGLTLENFVAAHKLQESGKAIGKIAISIADK